MAPMIRALIASALVFAVPAAAQSAVYRWEDAEGTTHYTNNPGEVPKGITVYATDGEPISRLSADRDDTPSVKVATVQVTLPPANPAQREAYWRGAFLELNRSIRSLEDEISLDQKKLEPTINGLPVNARYGCTSPYLLNAGAGYPVTTLAAHPGLRTGPVTLGCVAYDDPEVKAARERITRNKLALTRATEDLQELERKASAESVPREWRR